MKKLVLYALLLGATLIFPVEGADVAKLLPVEVVQLDREGEAVVITTDAGTAGIGTTVEAAVENMKKTAEGVVFLDTANYLLVSAAAHSEIENLKGHLKPSVRLCTQDVKIDLKEAAVFLGVHKPKLHLKDYGKGSELELLAEEDGRFILKEK